MPKLTITDSITNEIVLENELSEEEACQVVKVLKTFQEDREDEMDAIFLKESLVRKIYETKGKEECLRLFPECMDFILRL